MSTKALLFSLPIDEFMKRYCLISECFISTTVRHTYVFLQLMPYDKITIPVKFQRNLPNAQQQVSVSRVLGDYHYKGLARVTVGVAR